MNVGANVGTHVDAAGREEALTFGCEGQTLVGIVHHAAPTNTTAASSHAARTGVVVIVGGPQYRAGSHRQFVNLARALAAAGHAVFRFDVRGMGDGTGGLRDFEHIGPDVAAAIDELQRRAPGVQRVVLWGLCDGASAALLYLHDHPDARVAGICMLNPWVRSEASLARTHVKHYYLQRLLQATFWRKLLSGRIAGDAVRALWRNLRLAQQAPVAGPAAPFQTRMALTWSHFEGRLLLVLSGNDYTAREFTEFTQADAQWRQALARRSAQRHELVSADHTLSAAEDQQAMNAITLRWLGELA